MALSTHLLHSFEHQQALSTHRQLYPTQNPSVKREPFTPQYIITEPPPPAPQYNPDPSAAYNGSHGKPLPNQSSTRMDLSAVQGDRKPPITQRAPKAASHAFAMPPPSPLNSWEHHAPADPTPSTSFFGGGGGGGGFGQTQNQYHTQTQYSQTQQGENTQFMQMSAYTAGQIATLQSRLQKQLGPEYIMERKGPSGGPTLSYIEGWKAINLANEVFGFNGWSSQIISLNTDFCDEQSPGRFNIGITAIIRITLRDGTFHEDTGYGGGENLKGKGSALDKAKKEAVTDGIKRTLRMFGNVLGNCLYDKKYLADIKKIKVVPKPLKPEDLWRRPEFDEAFQASAQAGPSRPHPMNDLSSQMPTGAPEGASTQVKDEQGFVRPALPARLLNQNQNGGTPTRPGPSVQAQGQASTSTSMSTSNATPNRTPAANKDPAARAAGAQARARALAAAGMSIVRPTTTEVEEYYAQDDELFANMDMEDPLVGMTSTDFLTAEEAGMGETAEGEPVDDVRTDGFGAPPPGNVTEMGSARSNAETNTVVGPPPSLQRGRSAGGFVYPQNQSGNPQEGRSADAQAKKLSPTEAAAKRRQAIAAQMQEDSVGDTSGSTDEGGSSSRGMKRISPGDGDGFGYSRPGRHPGLTTARQVLGTLNDSEVPYPPDAKRVRS